MVQRPRHNTPRVCVCVCVCVFLSTTHTGTAMVQRLDLLLTAAGDKIYTHDTAMVQRPRHNTPRECVCVRVCACLNHTHKAQL